MPFNRLLPVLLLAGSALLIAGFAQPPVPRPRTKDGPVLPRKEVLRTLGASQLPLLSDFYWLRTVQQAGIAQTEVEFRDIAFFADLSTDLDPRFRYVYEWAGVSTPFNRGREEWVNTDLSEDILRKGLREFPHDPNLLFPLGFNLMSYQKRYRDAAEVFLAFAEIPDSPPHFVRLGTRLLAASGDLDASRQATMMMRDFASDEDEREFYSLRLLEIDREEQLSRIDDAVASYRERFGAPPENIDALLRAGPVEGLRPDPLGGEYFLDTEGVARSTSGAFRLEPYTLRKKREVQQALPPEYQ